MAQSSPHVQFPEGVKAEERPRLKQQPTQKYDRKEIQKRLDIETWMEEQLVDLFQVGWSELLVPSWPETDKPRFHFGWGSLPELYYLHYVVGY